MSGVDNIRGIDYQVTYSVLRLLQILINEIDSVDSIQFESLTENEEDMNIYKKDGTSEYIQIKKRSEGYNWTASDMKEIFEKFHKKNSMGMSFTFITDGSASRDVVDLKNYLLKGKEIENNLLNKFTSKTLQSNVLINLLNKTSIFTHSYTSGNDDFPGLVIKDNIMKLLQSMDFIISDSAENVYNFLWMYIFRLSQECKVIKLTEILNILEMKGLKVAKKKWVSLPDISRFKGRKDEIKNIEKALKDINKVVLKGISGIGKTSVLSKIAYNFIKQGKKVCWIELNSLYTMSTVTSDIASFLHYNGLRCEADLIANCEIVHRVSCLGKILEKNEIYLFIDSIDKGNFEIKDFFDNFIKYIINIKLKGSIACSTIDSFEAYTEIDIMTKKIFEYHLLGFSDEDVLEILKCNNESFPTEDIRYFNKVVGGYPISIVFLKELISNNRITELELSKLKELSIENSNKWLFNKTFAILEKEEQEVALASSIFNYPFYEKEAEKVMKSKIRPKYILDNLIRKNIIIPSNNTYHVHDSIRKFLYDMLTEQAKEQFHDEIAKYYRVSMQKDYETAEEVLYEDIMKWGYHLENSNNLTYMYFNLLNMKTESLDALWAIERFGFPFAYSDLECKDANKIVDFLLSENLIEINNDNSNKYMDVIKKYLLKNFDFFDSCFLHYLCLSREISNHLGYINIFEPNEAYHIQGICCPWEHCIEYMPLPPMTKSDYKKRINFLKQMFDSGAYDDKPEEIKNMFLEEIALGIPDDAPDEPVTELEQCRCPIFGHCCPDGAEQATYCRNSE